jgi:hypothetical protein
MNEFELTNLKQELEKAKSTNQFLSTKIRKLETASNQMIGEKQILQKRNLEKLQLIQRKISNKYACEVCQKDWDSINDFEKHLQKNRHGVQGELKIEFSDGRAIITFVKNLVEDLDTIPIGFDVPAVENDPGKEDFIDDPGERDEQNIVQDLFQLPIPAQALSTKVKESRGFARLLHSLHSLVFSKLLQKFCAADRTVVAAKYLDSFILRQLPCLLRNVVNVRIWQ